MKTVNEPAKRLKVLEGYDVLVAGGGPAGIAAAVAAARNGMRTLLIEQSGMLGGMSTAGLVPCFCPFGNGKEPAIRGIGLEILDCLRKANGLGKNRDSIGWIPVDAEKLKLIYDSFLEESGAEVLFFTFLSGVIKKNGKITYAVIENKSGRQAVPAGVFIDATGDADMAYYAGEKVFKGDASGKMQPASLCFEFANVDIKKYHKFTDGLGGPDKVKAWWEKLIRQGKLPGFKNAEYRGLGGQELFPGCLKINFGHIYAVDGTKASDLTRVMTVGRRMAHAFIEYAKRNLPGMKNAVITGTAVLPGIRETRRIKGLYEMSLDDYKKMRNFEDNIAVYDYTVDVHNPSGGKKDFSKFNREFDSFWLEKGKTYGINMRALIPESTRNLLVAGRSISSDRMMNGSLRVMPACFATGQAAGTAAALAFQEKVSPSELDFSLIKKTLMRQGAKLR